MGLSNVPSAWASASPAVKPSAVASSSEPTTVDVSSQAPSVPAPS
ncbi:hypothetical protein [Sorangium cellulosum]|nr:hypothetical protein [Sorangium cellulosum]